ncbi:MAG: hypothetical protein U0074_05660 [Kouleothrix sp.]
MYRSSYIAGILTNAFFGVLRSYMYIALYGAGGAVAGFTLADAISYTWVTQAPISSVGFRVLARTDAIDPHRRCHYRSDAALNSTATG